MPSRYQDLEEEEINITPMLDIVFIMLIFFIVTTSFVKEPGFDPDRPSAYTTKEQARANILIAVTPAGDIWMEKKRIKLSQVKTMVRQAKAEAPESSVMIVADKTSDTGVLVDLMDQVALGGITNIYVAAKEGEQ